MFLFIFKIVYDILKTNNRYNISRKIMKYAAIKLNNYIELSMDIFLNYKSENTLKLRYDPTTPAINIVYSNWL